ncbi:unnamed protein product, partial [Polarella glacialis]
MPLAPTRRRLVGKQPEPGDEIANLFQECFVVEVLQLSDRQAAAAEPPADSFAAPAATPAEPPASEERSARPPAPRAGMTAAATKAAGPLLEAVMTGVGTLSGLVGTRPQQPE